MSQEILDRVARGLSEQMSAWVYMSAERPLRCDSPIEIALGLAMVGMLRLSRQHTLVVAEGDVEDFRKKYPAAILAVPQFTFEKYRIDWALLTEDRKIFVECDGHDFHERTKEQAAHDRQKDRAIQLGGITVLRFTGSEIYRDPISCANQIVVMLLKLRETGAPQ